MLRNVVVLRLNEEATAERVAEIEEGLRSLPAKIEQIRAYTFGRDLGLVPGAADFAIVSEFDDEQAYRTYSGHPDHQAVVAKLRLLIAERMSVQYEL